MASEKDPKPTSSELFSSAKLVAEAAKSTFNNESDKVDKGKVAGAAADLLGAAQDYGKLDKEKGVGQYVGKAENYLHQYENTSVGQPTSAKAEAQPESHASGGGVGDYLKMAQGFLGK
ncbi:nodulin-related protein 1-like [Durio zibethinus]|uniref:Nodulin-related protein 1-like n=1 Tax=Durio zibethinus TaxID=66656 RepID=A0A6P6BIA8_DURZI|nr:nodulin-related protein 1-like [Durio zibethinus]